ncbi:MAG TPA: hypothetical protein VN089_16285, partial [Duganella sp.]|nr:hypothetical protein [Duganella sp.]
GAGAVAGGRHGTWLLDPYDISVVKDSSSPATLSDLTPFGQADSGVTEVDAAVLSGATANVVLQARHDITFGGSVNNTHSGVGLTAQAGNDINVNASLAMTGAIRLSANDDGAGTASGGGAVTIASIPANTTIESRGNAVSLTGAAVNVNGKINAGAGGVDLSGGMIYGTGAITAGDLNVAGGDVGLTGANVVGGVHGTSAERFVFTSAGNMAINGTGISAGGQLTLEAGGVTVANNAIVTGGDISIKAGALALGSGARISGKGSGAKLLITSVGDVDVGISADSSGGAMALTEGALKKIDNADVTIASDGGLVAVSSSLDLSGAGIGNLTLGSGRTLAVQIDAATRVDGTLALNASAVTVDAAIRTGVLDIAANSLDLNASVTGNLASIRPASGGYHIELGGAACSNMTNCLLVRDIRYLKVPTLVIGSEDADQNVTGIVVAGITSGGSSLSQRDADTTSIALLSHGGGITQTGAINVQNLAVANAGGITLANAGNVVGNLAVSQQGAGNHFVFKNSGNVAVANLLAGGLYEVNGIDTDGNVTLDVGGSITSAGGRITADHLTMYAKGGIGSAGAALPTTVSQLSAVNTAGGGSTAPINIANVNNTAHAETLTVTKAQQLSDGGDNNGAITIDNTGAMLIAAATGDGLYGVWTSTGDITLQTHSPLTIEGMVNSFSGDINLAAGLSYDPSNTMT